MRKPGGFIDSGAVGETRTLTPFGTAPSRQRVYQFHHDRIAHCRCCEDYFGISEDFERGSPGCAGAEGAGTAGCAAGFAASVLIVCVTPPDFEGEADRKVRPRLVAKNTAASAPVERDRKFAAPEEPKRLPAEPLPNRETG